MSFIHPPSHGSCPSFSACHLRGARWKLFFLRWVDILIRLVLLSHRIVSSPLKGYWKGKGNRSVHESPCKGAPFLQRELDEELVQKIFFGGIIYPTQEWWSAAHHVSLWRIHLPSSAGRVSLLHWSSFPGVWSSSEVPVPLRGKRVRVRTLSERSSLLSILWKNYFKIPGPHSLQG